MGVLPSKFKKDILIKGYLKKQGSINSSNWHARYFILKGEVLFRYDDKPNSSDYEHKAKETINMSACTASKNARSSRPFSFTIYESGNPICVLAAKDHVTMDCWVTALGTVSLKPPPPPATAASPVPHVDIVTQPTPFAHPTVSPPFSHPNSAPPPHYSSPAQSYPPHLYPSPQYQHSPPQQYPPPQLHSVQSHPPQHPPQTYPPQPLHPSHPPQAYPPHHFYPSQLYTDQPSTPPPSYNPDYLRPSAPPSRA